MAKPPIGTLTQVEKDQLRSLKVRFDAAYAEARAALRRGDLRAAERALREQRDIIHQLRELIRFRGVRAKALGRREPSSARPERVAWTLVKEDHRVELVLRSHPLGTELRCVHDGTLLWAGAGEARP